MSPQAKEEYFEVLYKGIKKHLVKKKRLSLMNVAPFVVTTGNMRSGV
jgi:hypothetical protein